MEKENKNLGLKIFTVLLVAFITISSVLNVNLLFDALKTSKENDLSISDTISAIKTSYTSKFKGKDAYINFNGLFGKTSGRTIYNDVALLNNGMLMDAGVNEPDFDTAVKNIAEFNQYLKETGKEYLYVQAPYKMDIKGELTNLGANNRANEYADIMVSRLKQAGVNTLDLRKYVSADAESVEKYYYRTDHHWNTEGAFVGFTKIADELRELFPKENISSDLTNRENWQTKIYEDIFLGSRGKRVGKYYAGVDDFTYLYPDKKYDGNMSCYVPKHNVFYSGNFTETVFRENFVGEIDYFGLNNYCAYIGGDYPLVQHRNRSTLCDLKVLFIKDSYSLPLQSFLSTVCREVEVIDPRHYKDGSIAEYVECYDPDVVIMMINPSVMAASEYYTYGIDEVKRFSTHTEPFSDNDSFYNEVLIKKADNDYNYYTLPKKLLPNTKYTITFTDVIVNKGSAKTATIGLYNTQTKQLIKKNTFDIKYCQDTNSFKWSFITPDTTDELKLLLYAGQHGSTKGNEVLWKNFKVYQLKEDHRASQVK